MIIGCLLLAVVIEAVHVIREGAWPGYYPDTYYLVDLLLLLPVCLAALIAVVLRSSLALPLGVLAAGALATHGVLIALGDSPFGTVFAVLAGSVLYLSVLDGRGAARPALRIGEFESEAKAARRAA